MKLDRIEQLAQAIEKAPHVEVFGDDREDSQIFNDAIPKSFSLGFWFRKNGCDTAGCIAGFCVGLFSPPVNDGYYVSAVGYALDIPQIVAEELCTPSFTRLGLARRVLYEDVASDQAAQAVRNLPKTKDLGATADLRGDVVQVLWGHLQEEEDEQRTD